MQHNCSQSDQFFYRQSRNLMFQRFFSPAGQNLWVGLLNIYTLWSIFSYALSPINENRQEIILTVMRSSYPEGQINTFIQISIVINSSFEHMSCVSWENLFGLQNYSLILLKYSGKNRKLKPHKPTKRGGGVESPVCLDFNVKALKFLHVSTQLQTLVEAARITQLLCKVKVLGSVPCCSCLSDDSLSHCWQGFKLQSK